MFEESQSHLSDEIVNLNRNSDSDQCTMNGVCIKNHWQLARQEICFFQQIILLNAKDRSLPV